MTDTSALRAFIEARLAEDERGALIGGIRPDPWQAITDGAFGPAVRTGTDEAPEWQREVNHQMWHCDDEADGCPEVAREWIAEARHIARHDPARVLREVAAKRAILAAYPEDDREDYVRFGEWESCSDSCPRRILDEVFKLLAQAWSDHPDYRTEWSTT